MIERILDLIKNTLKKTEETLGGKPLWREPILGALSASDNRLPLLKTWVSQNHLLPEDILPGARSVICFFLPFTKETAVSNLSKGPASREWAEAYIRTNRVITEIGEGLSDLLKEAGFRAGRIPATHNFDEKTLLSDWSHRHIAYLAGLGTFGINNMLITERGCAGRLGSLVTDYPFKNPHNRPDREYCLNKLNGSCGVCLKKCPAGAYKDSGFDRHICYSLCLENSLRYKELGKADVCGKCVVGLPCSLSIP